MYLGNVLIKKQKHVLVCESQMGQLVLNNLNENVRTYSLSNSKIFICHKHNHKQIFTEFKVKLEPIKIKKRTFSKINCQKKPKPEFGLLNKTLRFQSHHVAF